jgi:ribosome-associated heat shock protein Hsp15
MEEGVRIDKWLWAVRIFKTRSQATIACKAGKVKVNEGNVKPSHEVRAGEIITVNLSSLQKKVKVTGLLTNRVSAKLVENYMEDLTPQEEYEKLKMKREVGFEYRQRGIGRPTKKERREIEVLKKYLGD